MQAIMTWIALMFMFAIAIFLIYQQFKKDAEERFERKKDIAFNIYPTVKRAIYRDRVYIHVPNCHLGNFIRKDLWEIGELYGCAEATWYDFIPEGEVEWISH